MKSPIPIGDNRIITFLPNGAPVVADPRSIDSLELILGAPIEWDVMPLFERLLFRGAVVVDVGANFGVYTATALKRILPEGRIFAAEANPDTFDYLRWTLYANRVERSATVKTVNAAISERSGDTLVVKADPAKLGSASVWPKQAGESGPSVPTLALDDWIPHDLAVNVLKIDVEGHEPFVLKGATKLIQRSPNLVIIMELFEDYINRQYDFFTFRRELIDTYGFRIYRACEHATLQHIADPTELTGENYVFLSRADLGGLDRIRYRIYPQDLSPGTGDTLFYGPYLSIKSGTYNGVIVGDILGKINIFCTSDFGRRLHSSTVIDHHEPHFTLTLPEDVTEFEIVATGKDSAIDLKYIDLF